MYVLRYHAFLRYIHPQTRRTFVTTLMNVSLCLLALSFTVFGTTSLASAGLHIKVRILSTRTQTLHKPSLVICVDIHPDPGPFTVNNLPSSIRKLYNQVRRISSRIRTFKEKSNKNFQRPLAFWYSS